MNLEEEYKNRNRTFSEKAEVLGSKYNRISIIRLIYFLIGIGLIIFLFQFSILGACLFGFIFLKNRNTTTTVENNKAVTASTEVASTEDVNNTTAAYEATDSYTENETGAYDSEDNEDAATDYDYDSESNSNTDSYTDVDSYTDSNDDAQNNSFVAENNTNSGLAVRNSMDIPSGYYAIVNAFSNKRNALKYAEKLNDQSYNTYVVQNDNQYRTSIYLDTNESEARSMLGRIKQNVKNDAWLMKN